MDVYLAIVSKREVRAYADRPLPDDAVRRLLEAGRVAGSSRNRQARRFIVLRDDALARAAEAVWAPENVSGAALAVAIVVRGKGPTGFDAARAAQNMMLAAWGDGIGSCPNGIANPEALAAVLGHDDDEQVATLLSFGYPARPGRPREPHARRVDRTRRPARVRRGGRSPLVAVASRCATTSAVQAPSDERPGRRPGRPRVRPSGPAPARSGAIEQDQWTSCAGFRA